MMIGHIILIAIINTLDRSFTRWIFRFENLSDLAT